MYEESTIENKINQLIKDIDILTENISSAFSLNNERIITVEKLMWKIEKKLLDQEKFLGLLSRNELIDRLVTMKYYQDKIEPMHLQSEEYQLSSVEAMYYDDEDD